MDKLAVIYVLIPLLVAYLTFEYRSQLLRLLKKVNYDEGDKKEIIIGVLSARNNFEKRKAIRDTWWGYVSSNESLSKRVDLKFVVGNTPCTVPIADRTDPYTCVRYNMSIPEKTNDVLAVRESPGEKDGFYEWNFPVQTLAFKVHHSVILGKLGVHADSLQYKLTIRLLDAASQTEIVSTVLSKESPGVLLEGFRYKAVEPYLLPQTFQLAKWIRIKQLDDGKM